VNASVTVAAANATYYVRIDGVGHGDPGSNGYSDYGSVGQYQLAISNCDGTMPAVTTLPTMTTATTGGSAAAPGAPGIGKAKPGRHGGPTTAKARWAAPTSTGGAAIVGYRVIAQRIKGSGRVVKSVGSTMLSAHTRAVTMRLAKGKYRFVVIAYNSVGASPYSPASRVVAAR
jgi:hypothetical protein